MGLTRTLLVAGTGAALAYFLDPVSGRERREKMRQYWRDRMEQSDVAHPLDEEPSPIVVNQQPTPTRPATP